MKSFDVREKLSEQFGRKVGRGALLRDTDYSVQPLEKIEQHVKAARTWMAQILKVDYDRLKEVHTGANGRFDCDNYAMMGTAIAKAIHEVLFRGTEEPELATWPMAREDIDHTQSLVLSEEGFFVVEWITGDIFIADNLKILLVG